MDRRLTYWPRVLGRALGDTLSFFGGWKLFLVPVTFALGSLVHLYREGLDAVREEFSVFLSYGIVAFLLFFGGLFVWNLIWTPARMEIDAKAAAAERENAPKREVSVLERRIYDKEAREKAISRLWQLRSVGVEIRNKHVTPADYLTWKEAADEWSQSVIAEAGKVSSNLQAWLHILDQVRPGPRLTPAANEDHARERTFISERLKRVEEFLVAEMLNKDILISGANKAHETVP